MSEAYTWTRVEGKNRDRHVRVYTLSTCGWCRKMKRLLQSMDVEYEFVDIDLLEGRAKEAAREDLKKVNPAGSCPTLVVDRGEESIIGFQEDRVREALGR